MTPEGSKTANQSRSHVLRHRLAFISSMHRNQHLQTWPRWEMRWFSQCNSWKEIYFCGAVRKRLLCDQQGEWSCESRGVIWNGFTNWQQRNSPDCLSSISVRVMERTIMKDGTGLSRYLLVFAAGGVYLWNRLSQSGSQTWWTWSHSLLVKVAVEQKRQHWNSPCQPRSSEAI